MKKNTKKKNNESDEEFVPNMKKIQEKEKERLQKIFESFFGKSVSAIKDNTGKMKKKIYIYGFISAVLILLIAFYLQ